MTSVWLDSKPAMQCRMLHMLVQRGCYPRSAIGGSRGSSAGGKLLVHRSLLECLVQLRTCTVSKGPGRGCISSFTGASYPMLRAASRSRHVLLECDYSPKARAMAHLVYIRLFFLSSCECRLQLWDLSYVSSWRWLTRLAMRAHAKMMFAKGSNQEKQNKSQGLWARHE